MKIVLILTIMFASTVFPQSETHRWEAKEITFTLNENIMDEADSTGKSSSLLGGIKFLYKFFISDLDGDNCPFYPSCSTFLVEAASETDLITGILIFSDRFTRDTNLYKSHSQYPMHRHGKLFDPVYKYTLDEKSIIQNSIQKYSVK